MLYVDTNILYSSCFKSSNFHEKVLYFSEHLKQLDINMRVYPFTIEEYESSLAKDVHEYKSNPCSFTMLIRASWFYQEFKKNPSKYMNDINICRLIHSIAKGTPVTPENYSAFDRELDTHNMSVESSYQEFTKEQNLLLWEELKDIILSRTETASEYFDVGYRLSTYSEGVVIHDMNLLENVAIKYKEKGDDALGPKVLLITADHKLIKCRKRYPFVVTTEQFLEFMMPYLFIADIPTTDFTAFPNEILSAQLGINISYWKPESDDVVSCFLKDEYPVTGKQDFWSDDVSVVARELNKEKIKKIVKDSRSLDDVKKGQITSELAEYIDQNTIKSGEEYFTKLELAKLQEQYDATKRESSLREEKLNAEIAALKEQNLRATKELQKAKKTIKYKEKHGHNPKKA